MIDISEARERAEAALERAEKGSMMHVSQAGLLADAGIRYKCQQETYETALLCRDIVRTDVPQLAQDLLEALAEIERLSTRNKHLHSKVTDLKGEIEQLNALIERGHEWG